MVLFVGYAFNLRLYGLSTLVHRYLPTILRSFLFMVGSITLKLA